MHTRHKDHQRLGQRLLGNLDAITGEGAIGHAEPDGVNSVCSQADLSATCNGSHWYCHGGLSARDVAVKLYHNGGKIT